MINVRRERSTDIRAIDALHAASFPTEAEARLVDALRDAGRLALSLVAIDDDELVGHVGFSPVSVAGASDGVGVTCRNSTDLDLVDAQWLPR